MAMQSRDPGMRFYLIILTVFLVTLLPSDLPADVTVPQYESAIEESCEGPVAFVGDTQRTSAVEQTVLGREDNPGVASRILGYIHDESPCALVHLGDHVFTAASRREWRTFDKLMDPLFRQRVPVLPVLGNHDYALLPLRRARGWKNITRRFPVLEGGGWYFRVFRKTGFIFLNANFNQMSASARRLQEGYLRQTLQIMDQQPHVKAIIAVFHQAPWTNTRFPTGALENKDVQKKFLPLLLESKKLRLIITGHAHTYEHFLKNGVHYVVSGGGGGPRVQLLKAGRQRHSDLFRGTRGHRPFHYVLMTHEPEALAFAVKGFTKKDPKLQILDEFRILLNE
jgi:Icc-related predicted phosphoesterase